MYSRNLVFTKYLGPTDFKGSRIRVQYNDSQTGERVTKHVPYFVGAECPHTFAVESLFGKAERLGEVLDSTGYVFRVLL